ncbi:unnamed protein product [Rotaria sp. Silwood2]|nr:unnamed protein product [Rotaria sp. Silwood2]CAF2733587.1 unnamed protein product [Rotaria sp. Silwood2]CAF3149483.1 unnamed protein product [Rotaria sp. Silwood2]CAF3915025.1 unnamed protein product [Rotaria sp. Silwood2]CAF4067326.1 unnamed protein product [Rotaria sp. Silwood2]
MESQTITTLMRTSSTTEEAQTNSKTSIVHFNIDQQCPIQYVTVYNDRAAVTRRIQHHFDNQGTYDLVFEDFSPSVDLTSLHVSGGIGKACTILEVSYQIRYDTTTEKADLTPLDQLQSEFDNVQADIDKHQRELTRFVKQRTWLDGRASKLMNQDKHFNINNLDLMQQFMDFYHKSLLKLDNETMYEENEIKKLKQQQNGLRTKINEHDIEEQANRRKTKREVTISVHIGSNDIDIALEVSYLISNCSWSASYDVRVTSAEATRQKTQLNYYGIIVNKSQENWSDVQLSLSTATPSLGGVPPKLATLKIGYEAPDYDYDRARNLNKAGLLSNSSQSCSTKPYVCRKMVTQLSLASSRLEEADEQQPLNMVNVLAAQAEASMSSTSFAIPRRATIDADGKPHKVTIGVLDLTSTFTYTVIPKLSLHAYLKASTVNTSDKQLLAGPASVFMDNNYVTHSAIDNVCVGDTFDLPLGTDASVKVEYKPAKKLTDTQGLILKVHYENIRHETHLINTKSSEVTVYVYEQVPLSSDEKIKVRLIIPDLRLKEQGSNYTVTMNDSNNLEWKCILQGRGECRLPLEYTVEWPKDKRVEYKQVN